MGYRSDVRIITSKDGFKELKKYVNDYLSKADKKDDNLINDCDYMFETSKTSCIGWNDIKWYDGYAEVDSIMDGLNYLQEKDYSYRYARIGENMDDIEEVAYDSKSNERFLQYPQIIRKFDDSITENYIKIDDNVKDKKVKENEHER